MIACCRSIEMIAVVLGSRVRLGILNTPKIVMSVQYARKDRIAVKGTRSLCAIDKESGLRWNRIMRRSHWKEIAFILVVIALSGCDRGTVREAAKPGNRGPFGRNNCLITAHY